MAHGEDPELARGDEAQQVQEYRAAFEQSRDAIMFQDQGGFLDCNPATLTMFRVPDVPTFRTLQVTDISAPHLADGCPSAEAAAARLEEAMSRGAVFFEWCSRTWDGVDFPSEVSLSRIDLKGGPIIQAIVRDISYRKETEAALREREQELAEAQRIAGLGSWVSDFRKNEIRWSDEIYRIFGMRREEWGATHEAFMAAVHPEDRDAVKAAIEASLEGEPYEVVHRVVRPDGDIRTVRERGYTEFDAQGEPVRMVGTVLDITEQKRLEAALQREATTDHLTGLYNRQLFDSEMERLLARYSRYGTETALVLIDLDRFKAVNDAYGHDVGDRVLVELTERLAGEIRGPDFLARWGGEEFVALLPETGALEAARMAERLRRRIEAEPFGEVETVTISLGVTSFFPGDTPNSLMKRADEALYKAKQAGRNRVVTDDGEAARS